jgi:DNA polymerase I-like protein with 3'-5' exonuclease and polymerase domains
MNNKRKVYIHSHTRDYMTAEYIDLFESMNAELIKGTDADLERFIENNLIQQLDTETNVTEHYTLRELYVIQLGTIGEDEQHIIDVPDMSEGVDVLLRRLFSDTEITFLAHNAKFEYTILYKYFGIYIKNFKDTMLASRLITAGLDLPKGYNGLASLLLHRFGIDVSKASQTTFTGEQMSPEQLLYADTDVLYLGRLLDALMGPLKKWGLVKCFNLENKALRPIGDLTINGISVNTDILEENIISYDQMASMTKQEMVEAFKTDNSPGVQDSIRALNVIQKEDEVTINWNSSVQKRQILSRLYPEEDFTSTAKPLLTKIANKVENPTSLNKLLNGDTDGLEMLLASRHLDFLKERGMFIEKGALNMNFNSNAQLLAFFKIWYPTLAATGVKDLKKLKHPVIEAYKKYTKASKLVSSFGRKMFNYIEKEDGRIHAGFTQLVPTGSRMSSSKPNMQQAPSTEQYRKMFVAKPGWKLVDSDYSSAELFIAAYLSGDKQLMFAIEQGYDLHSYSSFLIFGQKWLDAGGSAEPVGKPPTKEAADLRKKSKNLSFSLLYGTGVVAFSENSNVPTAEGKILMDTYFKTFPELAAFFQQSGQNALKFNYVREPYFGRVRFFNKPKNGMEASHNKNAGMNYPPQSTNSSIMKYALCLMKTHIEENDLDDKVKLLLSVHDQQVSEVREDYADQWAITQTELMEKAAKYVIPSGVLKAESDIMDHWTKG